MKKHIVILVTAFFIFSCDKGASKKTDLPKEQPIVPKKQETEHVTNSKKTSAGSSSIIGIYKTKPEPGNEDCNLVIEITETISGLEYHLTIVQRDVQGKVSLDIDDKTHEKYITFEGIEWDEYEGDISNENPNPSEKEIPIGIDGELKKDTIMIQNMGNAMNYYTKISECGSKYIILIKQ